MKEFIRSGAEVFSMLDLASKKHSGNHISDHDNILDFGCGNGRLLRFIDDKDRALYGCDVNTSVVHFVQRNFPYVNVYCNGLLPPLTCHDDQFNLVYSFSVFSHLSLKVENQWLEEIGWRPSALDEQSSCPRSKRRGEQIYKALAP
jgi:SAM-dependent methyltransferase